MAIQFKLGELASAFTKRFSQEAQVLVSCGKLLMNDVITAISTPSPHIHKSKYAQRHLGSFSSLREIEKSLIDITPNILLTSSSAPKSSSSSLPQVASVSSTANATGSSA